MAEVNVLFQPVGKFCKRPVVTCFSDTTVEDAARIMRDRNVSSVVVLGASSPVGIVTDRDLRNKVVSEGKDQASLAVSTIMTSPLIVLDETAFLFEALYRMSRHDIHRMGVVDSEGKLVGIITDSDILRLQTRSPQKMIRDIEEAKTLDELSDLHRRIQDLVVHLTGTGVSTRDLVRLIAHLNDQLLLRLIFLLRNEGFAELPQPFSFIVLGSEGRREQTLTTDQDNALVYADGLPPQEIKRLESFSQELIDSLIRIGVPPCPGGIMAKNPVWRRSLAEWRAELDQWIDNITSENILKASMFFDLRTLHGDEGLEKSLKDHLSRRLRQNEVFLVRAAMNVLRFRPPLGAFGRFKVEKAGVHRGKLDVKKAGIFAITEGVKVLSMEAGNMDGGTRERLAALIEAGILGREQAEDLEASFNFLVHLRLRGQVESIRRGEEADNYIPMDHLNRMEKGRLKLALEGVREFQEFLRFHFRLDLFR